MERINHRQSRVIFIWFLLKREILFILCMILVVCCISGYEMKLLRTQLLVKDMLSEGIDYDAFREFKVSEASIKESKSELAHLLKRNPKLQNIAFIDQIGYFTFSMMARDFDLLDYKPVDYSTFIRGIGKLAPTEEFQELFVYYKAVLSDLEYFPVPKVASAAVSYEDSWNAVRSYGGIRKHEGTDLMASNNKRDFFPVISITDGFVEKMGWLEQGGNRIGIRSASGGYFYYAHLSSYAPELKIGDRVIAGQILGFMGDSGYGPEGTVGQFDVHLHLGVYVNSDVLGTGEMSVNPYFILRILEKNRTSVLPH